MQNFPLLFKNTQTGQLQCSCQVFFQQNRKIRISLSNIDCFEALKQISELNCFSNQFDKFLYFPRPEKALILTQCKISFRFFLFQGSNSVLFRLFQEYVFSITCKLNVTGNILLRLTGAPIPSPNTYTRPEQRVASNLKFPGEMAIKENLTKRN